LRKFCPGIERTGAPCDKCTKAFKHDINHGLRRKCVANQFRQYCGDTVGALKQTAKSTARDVPSSLKALNLKLKIKQIEISIQEEKGDSCLWELKHSACEAHASRPGLSWGGKDITPPLISKRSMAKCLECVEAHLKTGSSQRYMCTQKAMLTFCGATEAEIAQEEDSVRSWTAQGQNHPIICIAVLMGLASLCFVVGQTGYGDEAAEGHGQSERTFLRTHEDKGRRGEMADRASPTPRSATMTAAAGLRRRSSVGV
jgi:hypothetical protein